MLLRSTPFSHCFLEDLVHRGTTGELRLLALLLHSHCDCLHSNQMPLNLISQNFESDSGENFDNGDLIDLIMDVAEPPFGSECKFFRRGTESYRTRYMQCFRCDLSRGVPPNGLVAR